MYIRVFPQIGGFPPKWMVKITENPLKKVDELGGKTHYFWKHLIIPKDAGVFLRKRFSPVPILFWEMGFFDYQSPTRSGRGLGFFLEYYKVGRDFTSY